MANLDLMIEPDSQVHLETVRLRDHSRDEYKAPCNADQTGAETEIDVDATDISEGTTSGQCLVDREMGSHLWSQSQLPPDQSKYLL